MGTTNTELDEMAAKLGIRFYKPCVMKDELKDEVLDDSEARIVNINDSTLSSEENKRLGHWVCYYRRDGRNRFMCPYGAPPPVEVINYLGKPILVSNFQIQHFSTSICGEICLILLHLLNCDLSFTDSILTLYEMFADEK